MGAALVVAKRDRAGGSNDRRRGERDEVGARGHPPVSDERDAGGNEQREAGLALAIEGVARASARRDEETTVRERRERAPRQEARGDVTEREVERGVFGGRLDQRADPRIEIVADDVAWTRERIDAAEGEVAADDRRDAADGNRERVVVSRAVGHRQHEREPDRERRRGDADERTAREEACDEPEDRDHEPRGARHGVVLTVVAAVEHRDEQAAERHREGAHHDDVAEHGAGFDEEERHRGERDRSKDARAAIDEA